MSLYLVKFTGHEDGGPEPRVEFYVESANAVQAAKLASEKLVDSGVSWSVWPRTRVFLVTEDEVLR